MSASVPAVGICGLESYFPRFFVDQAKLESYDGVSPGKYTKGLGQERMGFCNDREDVYSIALTVVSALIRKRGMSFSDVGRLTVGTETILDHSKSIKSVLMTLFEESGNNDVEGVDLVHACYSSSAALFDALAWAESSEGRLDGRYAVVVCVDIAEYASGPARCTGGAGAVAMLVGKNPFLTLEPGRASYMAHAFDFFKPKLDSPYPIVDGKLSNFQFLSSLDNCFRVLNEKAKKRTGQNISLTDYDHCIFHTPYHKLVFKSYARLVYNDFLLHPTRDVYSKLLPYAGIDLADSFGRELYNVYSKIAQPSFPSVVGPSTIVNKLVGNQYTASLMTALCSLLYHEGPQLCGKRVLAFAYGSGSCSTLYGIRVGSSPQCREALRRFQKLADFDRRLAGRVEISPAEFTKVLQKREDQGHVDGAFKATDPVTELYPGTFYLVERNAGYQRIYAQTPGGAKL